MKTLFTFLLSFCLISPLYLSGQGQDNIENLFKIKCGICHTIGQGKIIGPDLANINQRRDQDWLLTYIRSSQQVIKSGDPVAVALFEEYNKVIMPDPMISDSEIKSILSYIAENSGSGVGEVAALVSVLEDATPEDRENGKKLFEGTQRFANGGPSCFSCHNDLSDVFFSENSLSTKDITTSFTDLGEAGVKAILTNPPFPVMAQAFEGRQLEEDEVKDLLVYLNGESGGYSSKPKMSSGYILYGALGALALLFLFGGLWYNRKSKSVNYSIYRRQIKSFN